MLFISNNNIDQNGSSFLAQDLKLQFLFVHFFLSFDYKEEFLLLSKASLCPYPTFPLFCSPFPLVSSVFPSYPHLRMVICLPFPHLPESSLVFSILPSGTNIYLAPQSQTREPFLIHHFSPSPSIQTMPKSFFQRISQNCPVPHHFLS